MEQKISALKKKIKDLKDTRETQYLQFYEERLENVILIKNMNNKQKIILYFESGYNSDIDGELQIMINVCYFCGVNGLIASITMAEEYNLTICKKCINNHFDRNKIKKE